VRRLTDLVEEGHGSAVGANEDTVNFFLSVERAAPLPIANVIGAVADGLPSHGTSFAAIQEVVEGGPIHRAGLGLDHPEILALEAARQVMGKTVLCGVNVAGANVVVQDAKVSDSFTA